MKYSVMLIDDSDAINEMNKYFFQKCNSEVDINAYTNGAEALEKLQGVDLKNFPDLILLDLKMPVLDGFEFLEKVKLELPNVYDRMKVILLTTSMNKEDETKMRQFECVQDYLVKPLTFRQVSYMVATQLST